VGTSAQGAQGRVFASGEGGWGRALDGMVRTTRLCWNDNTLLPFLTALAGAVVHTHVLWEANSAIYMYERDGRAHGPSLWGIGCVAAGVTGFLRPRSCNCAPCWNSRGRTSFPHTTCVLVNGWLAIGLCTAWTFGIGWRCEDQIYEWWYSDILDWL